MMTIVTQATGTMVMRMTEGTDVIQITTWTREAADLHMTNTGPKKIIPVIPTTIPGFPKQIMTTAVTS
jgi:hypothetical protein